MRVFFFYFGYRFKAKAVKATLAAEKNVSTFSSAISFSIISTSFDFSSAVSFIFLLRKKTTGIVTLKKLCDGLEISLYDFFNTETFKTLEQ